MELTCPKCHGTMRTYERNGVHVDQCADCRGIFLDRGELDRLIDAENTWHGDALTSRTAAPQARASGHQESGYRESGYRESGHTSAGYQEASHQQSSTAGLSGVVGEVLRQVQGAKSGSQHRSDQPYKKRKKESFLGELFG
jgi:Zn-finger nucleic acid-binding protein